VPFWFAVAPTVSTKELMSRGTPRFSSETRSAVSSVAFDERRRERRDDHRHDAAENSSGLMPRKNSEDTASTLSLQKRRNGCSGGDPNRRE
jgi:hypothetical protein